MFTYREEYYLEGHSPDKRLSGLTSDNAMQTWQKRMDAARNKADVIIAKNRHGKPESVHLSFFGEYSLFDNLQHYPQSPDSESTSEFTTPNDTLTQSVVDINDIPDDIL